MFKKKSTSQPVKVKNATGDVVISQNQTGGITAHTVNNYKTSKRNIDMYSKEIVALMKQFPIAAYRLEYSSSDPESYALALKIDKILQELKWQDMGYKQHLAGPQHEPGITFYSLKDVEPIKSLSSLLYQALGSKGVVRALLPDVDNIFKVHGWQPQELKKGINGVVIVIGPNPED